MKKTTDIFICVMDWSGDIVESCLHNEAFLHLVVNIHQLVFKSATKNEAQQSKQQPRSLTCSFVLTL